MIRSIVAQSCCALSEARITLASASACKKQDSGFFAIEADATHPCSCTHANLVVADYLYACIRLVHILLSIEDKTDLCVRNFRCGKYASQVFYHFVGTVKSPPSVGNFKLRVTRQPGATPCHSYVRTKVECCSRQTRS